MFGFLRRVTFLRLSCSVEFPFAIDQSQLILERT